MFLEKYIYSRSKRSYIKLNDWKVVKLYFNSLANFLLANQERFSLLQHMLSILSLQERVIWIEKDATQPSHLELVIFFLFLSRFDFYPSVFIKLYFIELH